MAYGTVSGQASFTWTSSIYGQISLAQVPCMHGIRVGGSFNFES